MNKLELIDSVAEKTEFTKADTTRFLDALVATVQENVHDGVRLGGLGTFSTKKRKARMGRNPHTGEEIKIPSKWAVVFKAGSELKELVAKRRR